MRKRKDPGRNIYLTDVDHVIDLLIRVRDILMWRVVAVNQQTFKSDRGILQQPFETVAYDKSLLNRIQSGFDVLRIDTKVGYEWKILG